jgi:hypothetical protein
MGAVPPILVLLFIFDDTEVFAEESGPTFYDYTGDHIKKHPAD